MCVSLSCSLALSFSLSVRVRVCIECTCAPKCSGNLWPVIAVTRLVDGVGNSEKVSSKKI